MALCCERPGLLSCAGSCGTALARRGQVRWSRFDPAREQVPRVCLVWAVRITATGLETGVLALVWPLPQAHKGASGSSLEALRHQSHPCVYLCQDGPGLSRVLPLAARAGPAGDPSAPSAESPRVGTWKVTGDSIACHKGLGKSQPLAVARGQLLSSLTRSGFGAWVRTSQVFCLFSVNPGAGDRGIVLGGECP